MTGPGRIEPDADPAALDPLQPFQWILEGALLALKADVRSSSVGAEIEKDVSSLGVASLNTEQAVKPACWSISGPLCYVDAL